MAHQVLIGIAQDVIAIGTVLGEIQASGLEDADQVGQLLDLFLARPEQGRIIEIGLDAQAVGHFQWADDLLVLAGVHAAAQFVARGPELGVEV